MKRGVWLFENGYVNKLKDNGDFYWVESQNSNQGEKGGVVKGYVVDMVNRECECEDHKRTGLPCKHWYAAQCDRLQILKEIIAEIQNGIGTKIGMVKA